MADSNPSTIIGPGSTIKGEFQFDGAARILGNVEGTIAAKGMLEIGDSGRCKGSITGDRVVIDGRVEGDVTARSTLQLAAKATLQGDLTAAALVIAEGATLVGHVRVGASAAKDTPPSSGASPNSTSEPKTARAVAGAR